MPASISNLRHVPDRCKLLNPRRLPGVCGIFAFKEPAGVERSTRNNHHHLTSTARIYKLRRYQSFTPLYLGNGYAATGVLCLDAHGAHAAFDIASSYVHRVPYPIVVEDGDPEAKVPRAIWCLVYLAELVIKS